MLNLAKPFLPYVYGALIVGIAGLWFWDRTQQYNAGQKSVLLEWSQDTIRNQQAYDKESKKRQEIVNDLTSKWLAEKARKQQTAYKTIEKEVIKYVAKNPDCDLSRGAVRLLNESADPGKLQAGYHPSLDSSASSSPSTITQQAQVEQCAKWGAAYHVVADQLRIAQDLLRICQTAR